mmetsp:Transcript_7741/g.21723  ORF Transcript_7741/g.21723 Transcript_7741/m.21723 type:complete len:212 (-) Transcript_7741:122-757(-)
MRSPASSYSKDSRYSSTLSTVCWGCEPWRSGGSSLKRGFVVRNRSMGIPPTVELVSMTRNLAKFSMVSESSRRYASESSKLRAVARSSPASSAASAITEWSARRALCPKCRHPNAAMNSSLRPSDCAQSTILRLSRAEDVMPAHENFTSYSAPTKFSNFSPSWRESSHSNHNRFPVGTLSNSASSARSAVGWRQILKASGEPAASRACIAA